MKIVGGVHRSRKLISPPETAQTRPIPARVKESIFNILRGHVEDAVFLDAFAGTGAVGIEALSRGARHAYFVERDRKMADVLRQNLAAIGELAKATIITADALLPGLLDRVTDPIDLAFFDPPYPMTAETPTWRRITEQAARAGGHLAPGGFLMVRTPWPLWLRPGGPESLALDGLDGPETHSYRHTAVHLYAPRPEAPAP